MMSERKKYNRLDMVQNGELCGWVKEVAGEEKKFDKTFEKLAKKATKELGFTVTPSHISSYAKGLKILPRTVRTNNPTLSDSLTERMDALEKKVDDLLEILGGE